MEMRGLDLSHSQKVEKQSTLMEKHFKVLMEWELAETISTWKILDFRS